MQDLKPQRAVESDGSRHFVGAQCDRADPLDHGANPPVYLPAPLVVGPRNALKKTSTSPTLLRRVAFNRQVGAAGLL
jgi:hypothetical protein